MILKVECKKAQPKEVMSPTGTARGRSRVMPYGMDAFMLGIGMLGELKKDKANHLSEAVHMSKSSVWWQSGAACCSQQETALVSACLWVWHESELRTDV